VIKSIKYLRTYHLCGIFVIQSIVNQLDTWFKMVFAPKLYKSRIPQSEINEALVNVLNPNKTMEDLHKQCIVFNKMKQKNKSKINDMTWEFGRLIGDTKSNEAFNRLISKIRIENANSCGLVLLWNIKNQIKSFV